MFSMRVKGRLRVAVASHVNNKNITDEISSWLYSRGVRDIISTEDTVLFTHRARRNLVQQLASRLMEPSIARPLAIPVDKQPYAGAFEGVDKGEIRLARDGGRAIIHYEVHVMNILETNNFYIGQMKFSAPILMFLLLLESNIKLWLRFVFVGVILFFSYCVYRAASCMSVRAEFGYLVQSIRKSCA